MSYELPIRLRLTLWYLATVCATFLIAALAIFIGFREAVQSNADRELDLRLAGVRAFLQQTAAVDSSPAALSREFAQHAGVRLNGDPFQVMDVTGNWIYRPPSMILLGLPGVAPSANAERSFSTIKHDDSRFRILTATVTAGESLYAVQLASNVTPIYKLLHRFLFIAIATIPAVLLVAGIGGYWLSRRAMQPVYEITKAADRISERNLSERLIVPKPRDELRQLSETLNEMLGRLQRAFAQITQFTADASHELRTPVTMIRTTAEHILQRERSVPEYQQMVGQILEESERTTEIIDNLLLLARADDPHTGQGTSESVDLRKVLDESVIRFRTVTSQKQLQFRLSIADQPLTVIGNRYELQSLFAVLLDNATKYTAAGGWISVDAGRDASGCWVKIRDSGIGIPNEDLPFIFDRFYRVDKSRSQGDGVGLGLSIAKSIVDAHKGQITVLTAPGEGATFFLCFPTD